MSPIIKTAPVCLFLLGRAGAGKTYGCLAAIAEELKRSARGAPLLLLTPEQSTAQMERRLATWPGLLGGYTRARVFSFNFLAREAFLQAGGAPARQMGEIGRVMLLRQAMRRREGTLEAFGQSARYPGVAESLSGAILEFQRYGWQVGDLEAWLQAQGGEQAKSNLLGRKVRDIVTLWKDYEGALADGGWEDPARLFETAAHSIRRWRWLDGARIWVDGFSSFTAMELTLLEALLAHSDWATIALCADPEAVRRELSGAGSGRPRIGMERLFENVDDTHRALKERLASQGWEIRHAFLPSPAQPTRLAASPVLAHLESRVLGRIHPAPCPDEAWDEAAGNGLRVRPQAGAATVPIELIEASDRRAEVEAVARRIVSLCRRDVAPLPNEAPPAGPRVTWRDIAVLARDLAPYEIHIRKIFSLFEIPFFLDRPRQIEGHPLARLILSALVVIRSGWTGDAVLRHLKCALAGLRDESAIAQIENFIRAVDPHGPMWKELLAGNETLDALWQEAARPLRRLETNLRAGQSPARSLWGLLEDVQAAAALEEWIQKAHEAGEEEMVQIHEQAWEQTVGWLEELENLSAGLPSLFMEDGEPLGLRERAQDLIELVESALSSTRARLIPPTLNQVTIGSVDRSRTPEVRIAFVMGLNDGEFPKSWTPDAIFGDEERDTLTKQGRHLGPNTLNKRLQEHFLAYIAMTRPSERLILTRPVVDDAGHVCDPSPYFATIAKVFPKAPRRVIKRAGEEDHPALPLRPEEWALRLSMALGRVEDLTQAATLASAVSSGFLLAHPHLDAPQRRGLELARSALLGPRTAAIDEKLAQTFWQGQPTLPVTALETYGECPFKFFASQMLRLAERLEARLSVMDLGTIRHELLDILFQRLSGPEGLAWGKVDPDRADAIIDQHLAQIRTKPQWGPRLDASALGDLTLAEVGTEMKLLVRALQFAGGRCAFVQVESEWKFGKEGELTVSAGPVHFSIKGKIDRVDAVTSGNGPQPCLLIDYKSGARRLNMARIIEGIDLQLLTYALAYREASRTNPAPARIGGFFYWPLSAPIKDAEPREDPAAPAVDARWFSKRSPSGIFEEDLHRELDTQAAASGSSPVFGFKLTKDGALNKTGQSHWPQGSMNLFLKYERDLLQRQTGRIAGGEIAISPYSQASATACDLCGHRGFCRKADPAAVTFRRIATLKRDDVLARLEGRMEAMD